tara:strand:- start:561 stop:980 length:420 start_codon:yes stop_codon:yes gene_type:complete
MNQGGKKFERVNRLHCKGTAYDVDLTVDTNCELFQVKVGQQLIVKLASTLSLTGAPDDGKYNPLKEDEASLADGEDYVMHGRVFEIKHLDNTKVEVKASFGGLLFRLQGEQARLDMFEMDQQFFIMFRSLKSDNADMEF